jgi:hypothetical protein
MSGFTAIRCRGRSEGCDRKFLIQHIPKAARSPPAAFFMAVGGSHLQGFSA